MRRNHHLVLALFAACLAAVGLFVAFAASAARPMGVHSLVGTFHFTVIEIRVESFPVPTTIYCNTYGRITFDGAGAAQILDGSGYGACSDGENPFEPESMTYTVDPEGGVLLTDVDATAPYTTHCQLLDKGTVLLCDGSGGLGGLRNPELLIFQATAVKL